MGRLEFLQFAPLVDVVVGNPRITPEFGLLRQQFVLILEGKSVLSGQFLQFLVKLELFLRVFVLFLARQVGLAESLFMFRFGLGHELRVLRRVLGLQALDVPSERLKFLVLLGDGGGCGIGVGQNILHPLEIRLLLHRLAELVHFGGGEFGVLGNLRQFFLNLDLFKLPARLRELGDLFVVSGKSLGSTIGGGFGGLRAFLITFLLVFPELFERYGGFLAVLVELFLCAGSVPHRFDKDITLLDNGVDLFLNMLLFAFCRLVIDLVHTLNGLSGGLRLLCYGLIMSGNQSIKFRFPLFLRCKRGIVLQTPCLPNFTESLKKLLLTFKLKLDGNAARGYSLQFFKVAAESGGHLAFRLQTLSDCRKLFAEILKMMCLLRLRNQFLNLVKRLPSRRCQFVKRAENAGEETFIGQSAQPVIKRDGL